MASEIHAYRSSSPHTLLSPQSSISLDATLDINLPSPIFTGILFFTIALHVCQSRRLSSHLTLQSSHCSHCHHCNIQYRQQHQHWWLLPFLSRPPRPQAHPQIHLFYLFRSLNRVLTAIPHIDIGLSCTHQIIMAFVWWEVTLLSLHNSHRILTASLLPHGFKMNITPLFAQPNMSVLPQCFHHLTPPWTSISSTHCLQINTPPLAPSLHPMMMTAICV